MTNANLAKRSGHVIYRINETYNMTMVCVSHTMTLTNENVVNYGLPALRAGLLVQGLVKEKAQKTVHRDPNNLVPSGNY